MTVLTQKPAFLHEMYLCLPLGFAIPVTKSLQHSSPSAFNSHKQECRDSYLGNLPLHEAQWQQHITSLSQQSFSLPTCLEGISEALQQGRSGQDTMCTGCVYSDRFFSRPLPAGTNDISPTAIMISVEYGSR